MAEVRHERRYLHPRLSHVLPGLAGSPLQQALGDRVAEVGASAGPSPTGEALREVLAAHLWPTAEDQKRNAAASLMRAAMGVSADSLRTGGG